MNFDVSCSCQDCFSLSNHQNRRSAAYLARVLLPPSQNDPVSNEFQSIDAKQNKTKRNKNVMIGR
jgi:hypothetical protein